MKTNRIALEIGQLLESQPQTRIVFAESCTGGLAAALLTQVPGISNYFCGSAVTYRAETKQVWLGVAGDIIEKHSAESKQTTEAMVCQVLEKTPEATVACAITGHLGPLAAPANSDAIVDGRVFVAIAIRQPGGCQLVQSLQFQLATETRIDRQREAAALMLSCLAECL